MDWLRSQYEKVKSAVTGQAQPVVDSMGLPQAQPTLGTPTVSGQTTLGGRRRKTRKHRGGKKSRRHHKH